MGFQKVHEPSKAYAKVFLYAHIFIRVPQPLHCMCLCFDLSRHSEEIILKGNGSEEHRLIITKF